MSVRKSYILYTGESSLVTCESPTHVAMFTNTPEPEILTHLIFVQALLDLQVML